MGKHVLLNIYECGEVNRLINLPNYDNFISELLYECRAEVVNTMSYCFQPKRMAGYTHIALLTTSHCSIHTWPEYSSAAIDVFTCGPVDVDGIVSGMLEYFRPSRHSLQSVLR